jgi:hypothetical protein
MKITKIDITLVVVAAAALGFLFLGSEKKLGPEVPADEEHQVFYRRLDGGEKRIALEKQCVSCHKPGSLPAAHPHKEECMVCHLPRQKP